MNEQHINERWVDQQQWQPGIPSPDEAWNDMLAKLDKDMPIDAVVRNTRKGIYLRNSAQYVVVVILLLLLNIKHTDEVSHRQSSNTHEKEEITTNSSLSKQQQGNNFNNETITPEQQLNDNHSPAEYTSQTKRISNNYHLLKAAEKDFLSSKRIAEESNTSRNDSVGALANYATVLLANKNTDIQKSKLKNISPTGSSQNNDDEEQKEEQMLVQAGLQWTAPVPVAGASHYFTGTSGAEQPWRVLLPGVWLSVKADKNLLLAEVNPYAAASFHPKSFYNNTAVDSVSVLERQKSITKVFGFSGAISFQHNIINNWWAGGGLQVDFWHKGLAVLSENKHNTVTNSTTTTTQTYVLNKEDWQYFSKTQLYPHLQLTYRGSTYQAGLRSGVTFTALADDKGAKNLMFTELFFRLPLISNNKK